jgi:hypothetical protein
VKKYTTEERHKWEAAYRARHPGRILFRAARNRARIRDIPFELKQEDVAIPTHCPILGIEIKTTNGHGKPGGRPHSPSIDRIDNERGYVQGNVQVISHLANSMKSTATVPQLQAFARWVQREYGL